MFGGYTHWVSRVNLTSVIHPGHSRFDFEQGPSALASRDSVGHLYPPVITVSKGNFHILRLPGNSAEFQESPSSNGEGRSGVDHQGDSFEMEEACGRHGEYFCIILSY